MPNSVIIIGASARAATESAVRGGLNVVAIDQFGDRDTRKAADRVLLFETASQIESLIAALPDLPVIPVGGLESLHEQLENMRTCRNVLAPSSATMQKLRSIEFLENLASEVGIAFPPSFQCGTQADLDSRISRSAPHRWLAKTATGSAGLDVFPVHNIGQLQYFYIARPTCGTYIQQRVQGRSIGASYLATASETRLLGVSRSIVHKTSSRPFLYSGSAGPILLTQHQRELLNQLGQSIVAKVGLRGLFGADLIYDPSSDRIWLLEINPRYTASMELHEAHFNQKNNSVSLIQSHVQCYMDSSYRLDNVALAPQTFTIKKVVWTERALSWHEELIVSLQRFMQERFMHDLPYRDVQFSCHDIPFQQLVIPANRPVLTLKAQWNDPTLAPWHVMRHLKAIERHLLQ